MEIRLGKKDYEFDAKTLKLSTAISPTVVVPHAYDFDKGRARFPLNPWGNDEWGCCVKVAEANQVIRLERLEQRRTVMIDTDVVLAEYKTDTGSTAPGDSLDNGLVMLDNNRRWRTKGFQVYKRNYQIAAFGELEPGEIDQLQAAVYLLHGVQFGFALPRFVSSQVYDYATWDIAPGENGEHTQPGSWGGHAVYCKKYDSSGFEILTWGLHIYVSNAFVKRYCDEAWAVVDDFDHWRKRPEIDVSSIIQHLRDIGASGIQ